MKAIDRFKEVQKINKNAEKVPFHVWTVFPGQDSGGGKSSLAVHGIEIMGDQINLGGDYVSLKQVREALEYLTDQFGGKVKWSK